jgi:hypothetical protein
VTSSELYRLYLCCDCTSAKGLLILCRIYIGLDEPAHNDIFIQQRSQPPASEIFHIPVLLGAAALRTVGAWRGVICCRSAIGGWFVVLLIIMVLIMVMVVLEVLCAVARGGLTQRRMRKRESSLVFCRGQFWGTRLLSTPAGCLFIRHGSIARLSQSDGSH